MDHPLTAYRRRHDLTLDTLADLAGTTKGNLSRIERGVHGASVPLMQRLVRATAGEITIEDLAAAHPGATEPESAA